MDRSRSPLPRKTNPESWNSWSEPASQKWEQRDWQQDKWQAAGWETETKNNWQSGWSSTSNDHHNKVMLPFSSPKYKEDAWTKEDVDKSIPPEFNQTELYHDSNLKFGIPLPKRVMPTEWSLKQGIAGKAVEEVALIDVIFQGYKNWTLRHLAMGRPTFFILAKHYDKSRLLYSINMAIKEGNMEDITRKWNQSLPVPFPTETDEDKKNLVTKLGEHIGKSITEGFTDSQLYKKVQELEKELASAKLKLAEGSKKGVNINGLDKYTRSSEIKFMQNDAPSNAQAKEVQAWISKILTKTQAKNINKTMGDIKSTLNANIPHDIARLETVKLTLIDHGCPVNLAAKLDKDLALKILAALYIKEQ